VLEGSPILEEGFPLQRPFWKFSQLAHSWATNWLEVMDSRKNSCERLWLQAPTLKFIINLIILNERENYYRKAINFKLLKKNLLNIFQVFQTKKLNTISLKNSKTLKTVFYSTSGVKSASRLDKAATVGVEISMSQRPVEAQPATASVDDVHVIRISSVQTSGGVVVGEQGQSRVHASHATKIAYKNVLLNRTKKHLKKGSACFKTF